MPLGKSQIDMENDIANWGYDDVWRITRMTIDHVLRPDAALSLGAGAEIEFFSGDVAPHREWDSLHAVPC